MQLNQLESEAASDSTWEQLTTYVVSNSNCVLHCTVLYLDPGEEDHDGHCWVEGDLPVAEEIEVGVVVRIGEEGFEQIVDGHGAIDVECDAADGYEDDEDVQHVPELLQVGQLQFLYLDRVKHKHAVNRVEIAW